jgi:hypothetical protein
VSSNLPPVLRTPRRILASRTAFWLASVAVSLGLLELLLRCLFAMPSVARRFLRRGPTGELIATLACYEKIRDHHSQECVPFSDAKRLVHPTLGWTNRPGASGFGDGVEHVNSQGMRALREFTVEKPADVMRVEIFGDSFAFGSEVADDAVYAGLLERELPRAEVLNFGVPGYGPDQMLLRFREEGLAFHPDVVVMGLITLIIHRMGGLTSWYKPYFTLRGGDLTLHGVPVPSLDQAAAAHAYDSRLLDVLRMTSETVGRATPDMDLARAIFGRFVKETKAIGARPVVVLYPSFREYQSPSRALPVFQAVCAEPGVECIDTMPAFAKAASDGVGLTTGVHWTPAGHRIVADALLDHLRPARVPAPR